MEAILIIIIIVAVKLGQVIFTDTMKMRRELDKIK